MLFSEYKEKVLELLSSGWKHEPNKSETFDMVLNHLNFIRDYHTSDTGHVCNPDYHIDQLNENLVTIGA
jgi:hypothetical protein